MVPRAIPLSMIGASAAHAAPVDEPPGSPTLSPVSVDGDVISEAEIAREMQHHPSADPHRARTQAARALVVRRLLQRESEATGLRADAHPMVGETHEEACIRTLVQRQLESAAPADRAACQRYYEQNRSALRRPDQCRVRHILLAAAPDDAPARDDARRRAEAVLQALRDTPTTFAELAARHSACPSRERGGDLGWIGRGSTTAEFERQVLRLPPGLAGSSIESRYGYHVVTVDEVRRGDALSYDEALPLIANHLEKVAAHNAMHRYLAALFERHEVRGLDEPEAFA